MRLSLLPATRTRRPDALPGLTGRAHVVGRHDVGHPLRGSHGPSASRRGGLRRGDVLVVDRTDLDRATAQAAVDAGVAAVLNTSSSISGRFPTLGAGMLADAGIPHLDRLGARVLDAVRHGEEVRVHEGVLYADLDAAAGQVATGRVLDGPTVVRLQSEARTSMSAHLESLTLNAGEFLKREHRLLLHGSGLPDLATRIAGRAVVVVAAGHEHRAELRAVRAFVTEQRPVVIGVDTGAVVATDVGMPPDVVVLSAPADGSDAHLPPAAVLRRARDVVVCTARGTGGDTDERLSRLGVEPARVRTAATAEDAALLLAHHRDASAIVGVGMHATLEEMLDGQRPGLAGGYLTRLEVGPRLVDATALPGVYAGRVGLRHLLAVLLVGLVALVAAILVTPVGQEWYATLVDSLTVAVRDLTRTVLGRIS